MSSSGLFISGVLAGWLAEWLFFTFFYKKSNKTAVTEQSIEASSVNETEDIQIQAKDIVEKEEEKEVDTEIIVEEKKSYPIDDLTKLKGIGPKLTENLNSIGITSYEQLSTIKEDTLLEKLEDAGARVINKAILSNLSEQATLANQQDWEALSQLQKNI